MSTVDPVEARRQREAARVGSPGAVVGMVIGLALLVIGAALEVRGLFGLAEFDNMSEGDQPPLAIAGMVIGLPLILAGMFIHIGASRRFTGRLLSAPGVGRTSMLFVGLSIGAWWGVLSLPSQGALWLIPVGATLLTAAMLIAGVVNRIRRRTRRDVLAQLVARGRIAPAVVVEIPEIDASSGGLLGPVTVKFVDANGVDRWVTKHGQWKRADLPATGDAATVVFDPERPSDTSRIWVGPAGSSSAADFERWHR